MRLTTILIKGVFVLLLPRYLDLSSVQDYANVQSIQQFLVIFLGLDLYKLSFKSETKSYMFYPVNRQFRAHLKMYTLSIPVILVLLTSIFSLGISMVALLLILSEHLIQETHRVLIYFNKHLISSGFSLIKSIGILVIMFFKPSLILVLTSIVLFNIAYLLILLSYHYRTKEYRQEVSMNMSISVISYTFIGALFYRLTFTLDRPIMTYLEYENIFIFSYYSMVTIVLIVLYDAVILSFILPQMYKESERVVRLRIFKKAFVNIGIVAVVISGSAICLELAIHNLNINLPIEFDINLFLQFIFMYTVITYGLLISSYLNRLGLDRVQFYINTLGFVTWAIIILYTKCVEEVMPLFITVHAVLFIIKLYYVAKIEVFSMAIK